MNPVIEALKSRCSVRKFESRQIDKEILQEIIDCGRLAPTARNVQAWEFVVITDPARLKELGSMLEYGKFTAQAGACVIVLSKDTKYILEDGSAATENIIIAAWSLGIGSCWIAGDKKDYCPEVLRFIDAPDDMKVVSLIALGYPEGESKGPAKRNLDEVLHWEKMR